MTMMDAVKKDPAGQLALEVVARLRGVGHEAFLVGGCVRDILLGHTPKDFDVATSATPDQVAALFSKTLHVGARFGVAVVVGPGCQVEVATYRTESGYSDRRRPDHVEFSDARHDALRRDFTINGMFLDPVSGKVLDFVCGQEDLQSRLVRAIGDPAERFNEDALRILRAVRFAARLDFGIEPGTFAAAREMCGLLSHISSERIRDELVCGFTCRHRARFLDLIDEAGILALILPEVARMKGCTQPPEFHPEGDVYVHTRMMLEMLPSDAGIALVFATLLHDVGKPPTREVSDRIRFNNHQKVGAVMADAICRRLVFPNDVREKVVWMVGRHMQFISLPDMKESTTRRFFASPHIDEELELHRVDCLASHGATDNYDLAVERLALIRERDSGPALPPPLVSGNDLIAMGLSPGPVFGVLLRAVQDAQLEGRVTVRKQALELLASLAAKHQGCE